MGPEFTQTFFYASGLEWGHFPRDFVSFSKHPDRDVADILPDLTPIGQPSTNRKPHIGSAADTYFS